MEEPLELALEIMSARAYVRAKQIIEQARTQEDIPDNPMIDMVWAIQRDIAAEIRMKRKAKSG